MIDKNKQYKTRSGYPVRIYATDGVGLYPVHGAYCEAGDWIAATWTTDGESSLRTRESRLDLIEVKPRIVHEVWVNVYESHVGMCYATKEDADRMKNDGRLACVKRTIDCEYGEGLE